MKGQIKFLMYVNIFAFDVSYITMVSNKLVGFSTFRK